MLRNHCILYVSKHAQNIQRSSPCNGNDETHNNSNKQQNISTIEIKKKVKYVQCLKVIS